jgi:hypothetical protein
VNHHISYCFIYIFISGYIIFVMLGSLILNHSETYNMVAFYQHLAGIHLNSIIHFDPRHEKETAGCVVKYW